MKVLIISATDKRGGAGIAAYRLCSALRDCGVDAQMLVQEKSSDDDWVILHKTFLGRLGVLLRKVLDRLAWWLLHHGKGELLFSTSWVPSGRLVKQINKLKPDIVHLHWVQGGMLRIEDIAKIQAPLVWTAHDMWVCTGGSHYCDTCHLPNTTHESFTEKWNIKRKKKLYDYKKDITIIALSNWLAGICKESALCANMNIATLPNVVDTNIFAPLDKKGARQQLQLPADKRLVVFGAMNATSDPRKGYRELVAALNLLKSDNVELIVFGANKGEDISNYKTHYIGHISSVEKMAQLYNVADVVVVPSMQEAFGLVAVEAMACKTPVVAFGTTGLLDIVDHKKNGYLAKPFSAQDLANGIDWVLKNNQDGKLGKCAREKVIQHFSADAVVPRYIDLYKRIITKKNSDK